MASPFDPNSIVWDDAPKASGGIQWDDAPAISADAIEWDDPAPDFGNVRGGGMSTALTAAQASGEVPLPQPLDGGSAPAARAPSLRSLIDGADPFGQVFDNPVAEAIVDNPVVRGARSWMHGTAGTANLLAGAPVAAAADFVRGDTAATDYWMRNMVDRAFDADAALQPGKDADLGERLAFAGSRMVPDIGTMYLTGGVSTAPAAMRGAATAGEAVRSGLASALEHSAKASLVPGASMGSRTGIDVLRAGGDADDALTAAAAEFGTNALVNAAPISAPGSAIARALQGAGSNVVADSAQVGLVNEVLPDNLKLDRPLFDPRQAPVSALLGAGMGTALGPRPEAPLPGAPERGRAPRATDGAGGTRDRVRNILSRAGEEDSVVWDDQQQPNAGQAAQPPVLALPAPIIEVSPSGVATTPSQRFGLTAAMEADAQRKAELGLTPDVERAVSRRQNSQEQPDLAQQRDDDAPPWWLAGQDAESQFEAAAHAAATSPKNDLPEPTPAQKEAGNYRKGHMRIGGLDISIENPAGSRRREEWEPLQHHYGYIRGTVGKDKDHVDTFLGPEANADDVADLPVFVVNQVDPKTGKFDEHKVMIGFPTETDAREGYAANYEEGWQGLGSVSRFDDMRQFREWLSSGNTKKEAPASDWRAELDAHADLDDATRSGLRAHYESAEAARPAFERGVAGIARDLGLSNRPMLAPLKGVKRAAEKVMVDYRNEDGTYDPTKLKDLVRGTIVVDTPEQARQAIEAVKARFGDGVVVNGDGISSSDRPPRNEDGYRDANLTVTIDGHATELQINTRPMLAAKEKGHKLYEQKRSIVAKAKSEGRALTADERARVDALTAGMREIYDSAWAETLASAGKPAATMARSMASGERSSQVELVAGPIGLSRKIGRDAPPSNAIIDTSGVKPVGNQASSPTLSSPNHSVSGGSERGSALRGSSSMGPTSAGIVPREHAKVLAKARAEGDGIFVPGDVTRVRKALRAAGVGGVLIQRGRGVILRNKALRDFEAWRAQQPQRGANNDRAATTLARTGQVGPAPGSDGSNAGAAARSGGGDVSGLPGADPGAAGRAAEADGGLTLQNRDRSRAASVAQMQGIASAPDAQRLSFSRDPNSGAPMVSAVESARAVPEADLGREDHVVMPSTGRRIPVRYAVVEADDVAASHSVDGTVNAEYPKARLRALNNGRVAGLQGAWKRGTAEAYRQGLIDDAALHGVSAEAIAAKRSPVLIRLYDAEHNVGDMGAESNASTNLGLSPTEQARTDARALPDLDDLPVTDAGDLSTNPASPFYRAFLRNLGANEAAKLVDGEGRPNKTFFDRLRAAVFARAYGSERMIAAMAEDADPDARNVLNALVRAAPEWAKVDRTGPLGDYPSRIAAAFDVLRAARESGQRIEAFLAQGDLIARDTSGDQWARMFGANARSVSRMATGLREAARAVAAEQQAAQNGDMFGRSPASAEDVTRRAIGEVERINAEDNRIRTSGSLFTAGGRPAAEARPGADRPGGEGGERTQDQRTEAGESVREPEVIDLGEVRENAASYGESRPLSPAPERGGVADPPNAQAGRRARGDVSGQLDLFASPAVGVIPLRRKAATLAQSARLVTTGSFRSGIERISGWQDVAHIIAPLRKSPQEQMLAVVADASSRPLAVIRHSVGTIDGSSVAPGTVFGAVAQVPGARHVWFAHNHPSGVIEQSAADKAITSRLRNLMDGSGIETHGMIVVAPGNRRASLFRPEDGSTVVDGVTASRRNVDVPIQERALRRVPPNDRAAITDPQDALRYARERQESGVLLLDNRHRPVGFLPLDEAEMAKLRTGDIDTGAAHVMRQVTEANAAAAIVVSRNVEAGRNIARLLSDGDIRALDVIHLDGNKATSVAGSGQRTVADRPFLSRSTRAESVPTAREVDLDAVVERTTAGWKNAPRVEAVESFGELPEALKAEAREQGSDGSDVVAAWHDGRLWLVRNHPDLATELGIERAIFHESWGHQGLRLVFGKDLPAALERIATGMGGIDGIRHYAKKHGIDLTAYEDGVLSRKDLSAPQKNAILLDELAAHLAQNGPPGVRQRIREYIGAIKAWLREHGFAKLAKLTDADLAHVLRQARHAVVDGKVRLPGDDSTAFSFAAPAPHLSKGQVDALRSIGVSPRITNLRDRFREIMDRAGLRITQGIVDQFAPLKDLDFTAYMQARLSRGTDGALEAAFLHGTPKLSDGALDVDVDGQGLRGILSDLAGEHDLFLAWVAGNRAERLKGEGRERLFTDKQIAELKSLNQGKMADGRDRGTVYLKAHTAFRRYQKAVLDIAEEAGLIDPASRKTWEHEFYVPFYRIAEDNPDFSPARVGGGLVKQQAFKALKGGKDPLRDLLANTLANWSTLMTSSMRNMAATKALAAAERAGIARKIGSAEKGSVWVMDHGMQVHYLVDDPLVLDALTALHFGGIKGRAMDAMRWFRHALTVGVTISPSFRIRNLLRDSISVLAVSDDAGFNPLRNMVKGWKATKKGTDTAARMLAGGGKIRFGSLNDGQQARNARRLIEMGIDDAQILGTPERAKNALRAAWDWWADVGDRSETINRSAVYERARARGATHLEASYEARDLMDFTMGGKWASVRFLTAVVPFLNARIQGTYKLGKGAAANPTRFAAVAGAVAIASALNYLLQRDDEDYKALPDWARDTYWCVKLGDKMLFIPKPFEVGAMGSVVERMTELAVSGDDYRAKDFAHTLANILGDQLSMNPVPQAVKPLIEAWANYDTFRQVPIDSMGDERLPEQDRVGPTTTAGAVAIGRVANVSPKKIDHLVRGYFGWLGMQAMNVSDLMLRDAMGLPSNPRRDLTKVDNVFVAGDFVKDADANSDKYVARFYDVLGDVEETYAAYNHARKTGNTAREEELADHPDLAKRPIYAGANKRMQKINQRIKAISNNRELSAREKRIELEALYAERAELARDVDVRARSGE